MTDASDPRPLLTTRGHIYVTLAAAQQYAAKSGSPCHKQWTVSTASRYL